ncbi:MAG: hypothetical protein ACLVJO_10830 [[Clostridium] scindens]
MYIVFTEEQGKSIRNKYGVSVIEYKRCIKRGINPNMIRVARNIRQALEILLIPGRKLSRHFAILWMI